MSLKIPALSLVVLIGPSGSGKSTFARHHFLPTEVISSDACRGLISDNENDQSATEAAFETLHYIAGQRLKFGRLTVVDATNVSPEARQSLVKLAREHDCLPVAVVFKLHIRTCIDRTMARSDRSFSPRVVDNQMQLLNRSLRGLESEGFRYVHIFHSEEEVAAARIERQKIWSDRTELSGPFDIIGDIHGCDVELHELLQTLGYRDVAGAGLRHPQGRTAIFLGDLVDRGPGIPRILRTVMSMVAAGTALCVSGNHEAKLLRKLRGRNVRVSHGLAQSLEQIETEGAPFQAEVCTFLDALISHYVLDGGRLVVAHAGLKAAYHGRASSRVRDFALYGETTGETDEFGLPVRYNWASDYRGPARVVYGHTPVPQAEWLNNTINIDTGCVFGGRLTALRYPELDLVAVPAQQVYYESVKPLSVAGPTQVTLQQSEDDVLDIEDVTGRRVIETRHMRNITLGAGQSAAALEVMSRFAADPRWLIYLPPTMSPPATSTRPGMLESPEEAFDYYRKQGISTLICEQKHMGSRAVVIVCRDEAAARRRFGSVDGDGICYTRTGRNFFVAAELQTAFLQRVRQGIDASGLWDRFDTDWVCLDCELLPWSAKAEDLLKTQYAPTGAAAQAAVSAAVELLAQTPHLEKWQQRRVDLELYRDAYRRYCWPVHSIADYRLAPFHLLATEGAVHSDKDHAWHMETLAEVCATDPSWWTATPFRLVHLEQEATVQAASQWWDDLTAAGGEGMVVKPLDFVAMGGKGLVQPAVKCRGREYLRLIYGPEYTEPANLDRLRSRGLQLKRQLALKEFALGLEALSRFVQREPLRRVHECVFAVLAFESEAVDPRL